MHDNFSFSQACDTEWSDRARRVRHRALRTRVKHLRYDGHGDYHMRYDGHGDYHMRYDGHGDNHLRYDVQACYSSVRYELRAAQPLLTPALRVFKRRKKRAKVDGCGRKVTAQRQIDRRGPDLVPPVHRGFEIEDNLDQQHLEYVSSLSPLNNAAALLIVGSDPHLHDIVLGFDAWSGLHILCGFRDIYQALLDGNTDERVELSDALQQVKKPTQLLVDLILDGQPVAVPPEASHNVVPCS
eukprot:1183654-Prorocentrum_minimum.AAC.2